MLGCTSSGEPLGRSGIGVPTSPLALEAGALARASLPTEIYDHCVRTYLFAELIAAAKRIDHDREIVYVASILHDVGLSPAHMSSRRPFEVDGAQAAKAMLDRHGIGGNRAWLAWDAIALHDNGGIAALKQPEVALVNAGVNADFGAVDELTPGQVRGVLESAPRGKFIEVFLEAAAAVAKRKPDACAHSFVADVGERRVHGFHLANFCDAVAVDPLAAYL
jgi:hypothetical protein